MRRLLLALALVVIVASAIGGARAEAQGPTCPNPGLTTAHASIPEGVPGHVHVPCLPD
jgi:hypothetical protein